MELFFDEDDLSAFYRRRARDDGNAGEGRQDGDGQERQNGEDEDEDLDDKSHDDLLRAKEILGDHDDDPDSHPRDVITMMSSSRLMPPPLSLMSPPPTATSSVKSSSNSSNNGAGVAIGLKKSRKANPGNGSVPRQNGSLSGSVPKLNGSPRRRMRKTRKTSPAKDPEVSSSASSDLVINHRGSNLGNEVKDSNLGNDVMNDIVDGENNVDITEEGLIQENTEEGPPEEESKYLSGFASLSEQCLGRRTVFYLKSEAMVGRITRHRIQTLASVMGVSTKVHIELSRKRVEEAEDRFRIMGEVLDAWCAKPSVRHKGTSATVAGVCGALDQARLTYHAGAIRAMTGIEGKAAPVTEEAMSKQQQRGSPTRRRPHGKTANGYSNNSNSNNAPAGGASSRYNFNFYREDPNQTGATSSRRSGMASSGNSSSRRSDGGTEDGSDNNSSHSQQQQHSSSQKTSREEERSSVLDSPTKKVRRKPKYTFDGRVQRSPTKKKPPEENERKTSDDSDLIDFDEDKYRSSSRRVNGSPVKEVQGKLPTKKRPKEPSRLQPPPGPRKAVSNEDVSSRNRSRQRRPQDLLLIDDDDYRHSNNRDRSLSPTKKKKGGLNNYRPRVVRDKEDQKTQESSRYSSKDSGFDTGQSRGDKSNRPTRSRSRPKNLANSSEVSTPDGRESRSRGSLSHLLSSPKKLRKKQEELLPPSPTKRNRSISPTKSANKPEAGSRLNTAGSYNAEVIASPTKSRYYYSKYGTWKELQKISQANMKKKPEEVDTLDDSVRSAVSRLEYLSKDDRSEYSKSISDKIRGDKFLASLCANQPDYLHCAVSALASFGMEDGSNVVLGSRTQIMVWYTLERLRRFWLVSGDPVPDGEDDILRHKDTMDFLSSVAKLCYNVSHNEQIVVTSVVEKDRRHNKVWLNFKQFGVKLLRSRLENFGIVKFHDRGPLMTEAGHFLEVRFKDSLFVDFLGSIHVHVAQEDVRDFSKDKLVACLPFFCGLSSKEESSKGQKMVVQFLDGLSGGIPRPREPDFYLGALQKVWLESQQAWLNGVYEGKLKRIYIYPPPGDKQIVVSLTKMQLHELIPLAYYLENIDPKRVQLEGLYMPGCGLDDDGLRMLGKNIFRITKVQMTGNYFTSKGIHEITRGARENTRIRSLDLSDSNFNDDCLERLVPVLPSLEELILADNFLTWYGIRKITQPQKKTKRLKRLDLSRCSLNEHAFYELIPLILKTEQVILEGNRFSPLELKIFARQVRESEKAKLDTLVLTNCQLDDVCLYEISKFAFRIPNLVLQGGHFSSEGLRQLAKYCRRHEWEKIKTLNLRGCKLTAEALPDLADIGIGLESLNVSYNNFSGADAQIKAFAGTLSGDGEAAVNRKIKFVDVRHCRLTDASKRVLGEIARKEKIEIKIF